MRPLQAPSDKRGITRITKRASNLERRFVTPADGGLASAFAQLHIGTTLAISAGTSEAIVWDDVNVDESGIFEAGSGTTPWTVTAPGQYQMLLAITPNGSWPTLGDGPIVLVPDGLASFNIKEGGMYQADGSELTIMLTGFLITETLPAPVQIRVSNETSADITIVGGDVKAIMNRLGPQVP